jgi:hypothetical protein
MIQLIEERNKLWFYIRTISKSLYDLTDKKNIGLDIFNERMTELINDKIEELSNFI